MFTNSRNVLGWLGRPDMMRARNLFRCAVAFAAALALLPGAALAQAPDAAPGVRPSRPPSSDVQAVFETLLYRGCERQIKPVLEGFVKEIAIPGMDDAMNRRICGCTVRIASNGPRMKSIFESPPERLKDIASDKDVSDYVKAKTASALFQCMGFAIDSLVDPKPKPQ
jgi:hypothetical protein